jgi:hypothetical protein
VGIAAVQHQPRAGPVRDRVSTPDLELAPRVPLTLGAGAGLDVVCAAADRAGITITGLP